MTNNTVSSNKYTNKRNRKENCVFVATTTYDDAYNTERLLQSFNKQSYKNSILVIVDHGKLHKNWKHLCGRNLRIIVLYGSNKLWWTGSINQAIQNILQISKAGDYILTINNDCTLDDDFLSKIVNIANKENRAIIGSFDVDAKDKKTIVAGAIVTDWRNSAFKNIKESGLREADTLSTKGTMIPIEVFLKIGLLDELHFPHYGSDYEFFIRAKKNGFRLLTSSQLKTYCNGKRTGMLDPGGRLSIRKIMQLLFSRKSQINLMDHINLITFCCPKKYKIQNYLFILKRLVYLFSRVYPFYFIRQLIYDDE